MLHRVTHPTLSRPLCRALIFSALISAGAARGQPAAWAEDAGATAPGVMTEAERQAFVKRHGPRRVTLRRLGGQRTGAAVGVDGVYHGWRLAPGRVISTERLVQRWPVEAEDRLEIAAGKGWRAVAPGWVDARAGLAILDVGELTGAKVEGEAPVALTPPLEGGQSAWALVSAGEGLAARRIQISGAAPHPYSFYMWAPGVRLPAGTPILNGEGALISLASPSLWGIHEADGTALLPTSALKQAMEAKALWLPDEAVTP